jgi:hypothetical protein
VASADWRRFSFGMVDWMDGVVAVEPKEAVVEAPDGEVVKGHL